MRCVTASLLLVLLGPLLQANDKLEKGTVAFVPLGDQKNIPERYRLEAHQFDYEMSVLRKLPISNVEVFAVRFPSPVNSPYPENNIVHAEYYRPKVKKPGPCVIVLDITGGDQQLSKLIAAEEACADEKLKPRRALHLVQALRRHEATLRAISSHTASSSAHRTAPDPGVRANPE